MKFLFFQCSFSEWSHSSYSTYCSGYFRYLFSRWRKYEYVNKIAECDAVNLCILSPSLFIFILAKCVQEFYTYPRVAVMEYFNIARPKYNYETFSFFDLKKIPPTLLHVLRRSRARKIDKKSSSKGWCWLLLLENGRKETVFWRGIFTIYQAHSPSIRKSRSILLASLLVCNINVLGFGKRGQRDHSRHF